MRRILAAFVVAVVTVAATPATAAVEWRPRLGSAVRYAEARQGEVSVAVVDTQRRQRGHRARRHVPAASVLKVMYLVRYLRAPSVRDRALRRADKDLLRPMIRRSANAPATAIADRWAPRPLDRLARRARMRDFAYTRPWGLTSTSARDQVRFMRKLPRYLPDRHRAYGLRLLRRIAPDQRWGVGEIRTPGWTKRFKGGWGSGTGAMDHQVVRLEHRDGTVVSLAVMTTDSPSHAYGKRTLRGVFRRLLADLPR